jgi:predicted MFS family arabinose efflux permease
MSKIGFSEGLLVFAIAALWHNQMLAIIALCLAIFGAVARVSIDFSQKTKEAEVKAQAAKILNEQVQEVGDAIGSVFGKKKTKTNNNFH